MSSLKLKSSALFISLALTGCFSSDENNNNQNTIIEEPSIENPSSPNEPLIIGDYKIENSYLISSQPIDRLYSDSFSLDDISLYFFDENKELKIVNNTPLYFNNPTIKINDKYYKLYTDISPFEEQVFSLEKIKENITTVIFINEQPFFKIFNKGYFDHLNSEELTLASEHNAKQFEYEMRAYKNALNDLGFNLHFAEYISSYGTARSTFSNYSYEDIDCPLHDSRSGNDSSPSYTKILSTLIHEPQSAHYKLTQSYNGLATIGNGWLSVRDFRLYQNGQTLPKTTYLHEKMHNHGFGHSGGLTYGLPDVLINYMREGYFDNYYDGEFLSKNIPTTVTDVNIEQIDSNYLSVNLSFYSQKESHLELDPAINRFMLVFPNIEYLDSIQILNNDEIINLTPTLILAEGNAMYFDSMFEIPVHLFNHQENDFNNQIKIKIKRPAEKFSFVFLGSGNEADWSQQANSIIEINAEHGLLTDDNQMVFLENNNYHLEDGSLSSEYQFFTPQEAIAYCRNKGLSLGFLKPYKSTEQMNFQMKYLPYQSQVGIDPDTLEPVAVAVASSYRPEYVEYSDKGELVVCQ